jgi:hypothetical protein
MVLTKNIVDNKVETENALGVLSARMDKLSAEMRAASARTDATLALIAAEYEYNVSKKRRNEYIAGAALAVCIALGIYGGLQKK